MEPEAEDTPSDSPAEDSPEGRPERSEERELRRAELLDAADRVVRREGPRASMNAIAAEAGISKPILYRHFGDKNGLYNALADRHAATLLDRIHDALAAPLDRRERVENVLDTYLAAIESAPQVYRFLAHPDPAADGLSPAGPLAPTLRAIAAELSIAIAAQVDLGPGGGVVAEAWGQAITGMVLAAGDWWLEREPFGRERMVQILADLLWGRLAAAGENPAATKEGNGNGVGNGHPDGSGSAGAGQGLSGSDA